MDESTRASREAPLSCDEIPAPSRDPPPGALSGLAPLARALEGFRSLAEAVLRRAGVPKRDAPDVVQDLLIALLPRWAERAAWSPEKQRTYVAGAARRAARRHLGRAARKGEVLVSGHALRDLLERAARGGEAQCTAEDLLLSQDVWSERAHDARRAFVQASMAPAYWRVFHAYVLLGVPIAAIARREQAPVGTIYNRLRLAWRDLHAALARDRAARHPLFA